jgi:YVTN family beta-propeller protein
MFTKRFATLFPVAALLLALPCPAYEIWVSNEKSGDVTIIDSTSRKALATFPVGKRPRGIRVSPDNRTVFVALSGTPISGPPQLDAKGNPILHKGKDDDDDDDKKADKSADGIAVIDVGSRNVAKRIKVGSDPEQLAVSPDGKKLYVSNEDVGTASVVDIGSGKVQHIIPVSREPEGVGIRPDGKVFYVTCETEGEIYAIDTTSFEVAAHFNVGGRPRSAAFLADSSRAFIPSESSGQLHLVDAVNHKLLKTESLPKGCRPMCVKVSPDGKKLYASTGRAGTICVADTATLQLLSTIKAGARPWGIDISPDGTVLYAANGPSDDVSVIDLKTEKELAKVKAGSSPWGVAIIQK